MLGVVEVVDHVVFVAAEPEIVLRDLDFVTRVGVGRDLLFRLFGAFAQLFALLAQALRLFLWDLVRRRHRPCKAQRTQRFLRHRFLTLRCEHHHICHGCLAVLDLHGEFQLGILLGERLLEPLFGVLLRQRADEHRRRFGAGRVQRNVQLLPAFKLCELCFDADLLGGVVGALLVKLRDVRADLDDLLGVLGDLADFVGVDFASALERVQHARFFGLYAVEDLQRLLRQIDVALKHLHLRRHVDAPKAVAGLFRLGELHQGAVLQMLQQPLAVLAQGYDPHGFHFQFCQMLSPPLSRAAIACGDDFDLT